MKKLIIILKGFLEKKKTEIEKYQQYGIERPLSRCKRESIMLACTWCFMMCAAWLSESLSAVWAGILALAGVLCAPVLVLKSYEDRKRAMSIVLDHYLYALTYRQGLLMQSGFGLRKALQLALERDVKPLEKFQAWKETLQLLSQGAEFQTTLEKLQVRFRHHASRQLIQIWIQGEKKSEEDAMIMLQTWMAHFREKEMDIAAGRQSVNALWLLLPPMINFTVLIALLISPIFLGGLNL
jgi:Flp pilus assembly protein TadB